MQTRKQSLIETTTSVLIGYLVALASQMAIFPIFGILVYSGFDSTRLCREAIF